MLHSDDFTVEGVIAIEKYLVDVEIGWSFRTDLEEVV